MIGQVRAMARTVGREPLRPALNVLNDLEQTEPVSRVHRSTAQ